MNNNIYDLMYCGEHEEEIRATVLNDFPSAKIEDASDYIHRGRFSVELEIEESDWLLWVMRNGFHRMSLHWEMAIMERPEYLNPLIKQVIAEQRAEGWEDVP